MAYEHLIDKDVNLSKLGFGDSLTFDFDQEKCYLRISVFQNGHYQDHFVVDLKDEFNIRDLEVDLEPDTSYVPCFGIDWSKE